MDKEDTVYTHTHTHTHTRIQWNILIRKKEWSNAIVVTLAGSRDYHTKWSKPEREKQISSDIAYMWTLKDNPNELIYETDSQT